jgi:ATP/ADP translocase/HEAT repeat protein
MLKFIEKWLNIYEDEIGLFMWSMVLLFLIRSSGIIFNNFAETAFLKRYGVEYLPIVYMVNSIATFIIMGMIAGIMARLPGARLLSYLLLFCGTTVAGIRFLLPLGFDIFYPLLFVLKAQYEILLGLLFWNLANDLFNTRQSKRLFPLITAGGVLGDIIGSFGTPIIAKIISIDNLMLIYLGTTMLGALTVKGLGSRFPTILIADKKTMTGKKGKSRTGIIEEIKKIIPLMKESTLVKILVLLTFLPNVIVPIMNYQFNFAINEQFATEGGLIAFFGYFRGFMNVISLFLLLFVGRAYGRLGLPVVLMFHPFNYILAFLAFLLRFDVFSAMYARMSTNILRTTFNKPASAVLMGLFPESHRAAMRAFLRGTVVRIGLLISSGIILISENLFHPRYLSLVAIPIVSAWVMTAISLKKSYPKILLNLISEDRFDLKAFEEKDMEQLFSGSGVGPRLTDAFLTSRGNRSLWYARLLKSLGIKDLDKHILTALQQQEGTIRIGLMELLSPNAGKSAPALLANIAESEKNPDVAAAAVKAANRLKPELSAMFDYEPLLHHQHPEIRAHSLIGLYRRSPGEYDSTITSWLNSNDVDQLKAGIIAAGNSGDHSYTESLKEILADHENEPVLPDIINGLHKLETAQLNDLLLPFLSHKTEKIRKAALRAIKINDDVLLKKVIAILDDPFENIVRLAKQKIETAPYQNTQLLVESLAIPNRRIRKSIFDLLESMDIKHLDIFRFAKNQLNASYQYLSDAVNLEKFPETHSRDLLINHLRQKEWINIQNILQVLSAQDHSGKMKIIYMGLLSKDTRKRSNALEALDSMMDKSLFNDMVPLMEIASVQESLNIGRKKFKLIGLDDGETLFISHLLSSNDWVTTALTLDLLESQKSEQIDLTLIRELTTSENKYICQSAQRIIDQQTESEGRHGE